MSTGSFATSPLGQVAVMMAEEGARIGHTGMVMTSEVCLARAYDADEDVQLLIRALLFQYASSRGVDVTALPRVTIQ